MKINSIGSHIVGLPNRWYLTRAYFVWGIGDYLLMQRLLFDVSFYLSLVASLLWIHSILQPMNMVGAKFTVMCNCFYSHCQATIFW